MNETSLLMGPIVTGAIMSGVLTVLFLAQERYKTRRERVRYARLIGVELNRINDIVRPLPWMQYDTKTNHLVGLLPRNTYDGLVASSMISVFDASLQIHLHTFYRSVTVKQTDYLRRNVKILLDDVYRFRRWNERRQNFFTWWREDT